MIPCFHARLWVKHRTDVNVCATLPTRRFAKLTEGRSSAGEFSGEAAPSAILSGERLDRAADCVRSLFISSEEVGGGQQRAAPGGYEF